MSVSLRGGVLCVDTCLRCLLEMFVLIALEVWKFGSFEVGSLAAHWEVMACFRPVDLPFGMPVVVRSSIIRHIPSLGWTQREEWRAGVSVVGREQVEGCKTPNHRVGCEGGPSAFSYRGAVLSSRRRLPRPGMVPPSPLWPAEQGRDPCWAESNIRMR